MVVVNILEEAKKVNQQIEMALSNQPSAADTNMVDEFFNLIADLAAQGNALIGTLTQLVSRKHVEYFNSLDPKDKVWILCKNSSTNTERYGNIAAGESAIQLDRLDRNLSDIRNTRIGYSSLLKQYNKQLWTNHSVIYH